MSEIIDDFLRDALAAVDASKEKWLLEQFGDEEGVRRAAEWLEIVDVPMRFTAGQLDDVTMTLGWFPQIRTLRCERCGLKVDECEVSH